MPVISPGSDEAAAQALAPPKLCAGCGAPIADRFYLLAVERQWHTRCLRCCHCKQQLDSELTCFARDGNIYCKDDYYRLFAVKRCARCQQGIFASELVMRARDLVYHLHCFTCAWCNAALAQGDHFGLRDNLVYCRTHFELLAEGCQPGLPPPPPPPLLPDDDGGGNGGPACSPPLVPGAAYAPPQGAYGVRKGRPRKRKPGELPEGPPHLGLQDLAGLDSNGSTMLQQQQQQQQRTKRMRTSFKHHQLRTMKSYFAINQNPDAKDLKQLAQKTGLSKRVLQVWFQNARAKWRRNNVRQQEQPTTSLPASSPGGTSSFSEPSPGAPLDYSNAQTTLVVTASQESLGSFQELF
ncbi:LIM/homeobox protein Lhx9 [Rhipicephalus microplus]|uniref:LIM/homeobox protein Lhx9 n=1 Tax=Rhipicephalus microplus TaxID=6941 RepID=UPI003F6C79B0